jgi:hypothetical protein
LILAFVIGAIVGIGAFQLTSMWSSGIYIGFCSPTLKAGFDPWTGSPHGNTLDCAPISSNSGSGTVLTQPGSTLQQPTPPEIASRRAIPVPLGFMVGAGLVLFLPRARELPPQRGQ